EAARQLDPIVEVGIPDEKNSLRRHALEGAVTQKRADVQRGAPGNGHGRPLNDVAAPGVAQCRERQAVNGPIGNEDEPALAGVIILGIDYRELRRDEGGGWRDQLLLESRVAALPCFHLQHRTPLRDLSARYRQIEEPRYTLMGYDPDKRAIV